VVGLFSSHEITLAFSFRCLGRVSLSSLAMKDFFSLYRTLLPSLVAKSPQSRAPYKCLAPALSACGIEGVAAHWAFIFGFFSFSCGDWCLVPFPAR